MSTPPRYFQTGLPYHIYNRGNRKDRIFLDTKDYLRFTKRLKEYKEKFEIDLLCYCLMPNHFHLLVQPKTQDSITKFMLSLCTSYSKYFNIKHEQVGRLFQERYRAKVVETDKYLLHLSRYIHLNPISDLLEDLNFALHPLRSTPGVERKKLLAYPWSSYNEYCNQDNGLCNTKVILAYFSKTNVKMSYQTFVESGITHSDGVLIKEFI